ncbi:MAG: hypothetical protein CO141_00565 [Candidatus Moranbacteria bacterium CG_4_9_14_3_um_filter_42_9]|nr:MAG: hypothetical protein CO141_00565 [Candidatus Moranbacteria bacterium CG_4_9_14_3_um_filter_42_9]
MNFSLLLSKLGLSQKLSQDVMLILIIALISFVYGMLLGKYKIMTVLINIYVSFALISVIPKDFVLDYNTKLILFFVLVAGLTLVSKRFFDLSISGAGSYFLLKVFLMSFLQVALVLSIVFSTVSKKVALEYVSLDAYGYLTAGFLPLVWMVLPLAYMFFIYKRFNR